MFLDIFFFSKIDYLCRQQFCMVVALKQYIADKNISPDLNCQFY